MRACSAGISSFQSPSDSCSARRKSFSVPGFAGMRRAKSQRRLQALQEDFAHHGKVIVPVLTADLRSEIRYPA